MEEQELPQAESDDADDVRWALETAQAVWQQGERRAALSWVRRAAEAAAEHGLDTRAVQLAKAGAEIRGLLDIPRTLPPPPPAPTETTAAPALSRERVRHHAVRVAVTLSPDHDGAFLAWPLKPGEAAPSNAHEALFVAVDPEADLFVFKL